MTNKHDDGKGGKDCPGPSDVPHTFLAAFAAFIKLIQNREEDQVRWVAVFNTCRNCAVAWIQHSWPRLKDEAEDVFQGACQSALTAIKNGVVTGDPGAWFYTIVKNAAAKCSGRLAKRDQKFRRDHETMLNRDGGFESAAPREEHPHEDEISWLRECIAKLPQRQGVAVTLKCFELLCYEQIADALTCTSAAARTLVCRGITTLTDMMNGESND